MGILRTPLMLIGFTVVLQATLLQYFSLQGTRLDLFLVCALYLGLFRDNGGGYGFLTGLLQDISGGGFLGANTLSKGLLGLLSEWIRRHFLKLPCPILSLFFFFGKLFRQLPAMGADQISSLPGDS